MSLWPLFTLFCVGIQTRLGASYCNDVKYITIDDPRRSTAYNSSSANLCDRYALQDNAWYRFSSSAGGEIPTIIPKLGSCGTTAPIWMKGSHPSVEEGTVTRQVCAFVAFQLPIGCGTSYNIGVRNCSGFYIYRLKSPLQCNSAYCAG